MLDNGQVERAEKRAKQERENMIKDEFSKRKGKLSKKELFEKEKEKKKDEEEALRASKVKAAEHTSKKISGLEISQRESYLSLLENVIRSNYDEFSARAKSGDVKPITAFEIQKLAIEEEYKIFTNNKVVTMYRRGMAYLMANIKSKTDKWDAHDIIKDWLETPEAGKLNGFTMKDWVTTPKSQEKKVEKTSSFNGMEI